MQESITVHQWVLKLPDSRSQSITPGPARHRNAASPPSIHGGPDATSKQSGVCGTKKSSGQDPKEVVGSRTPSADRGRGRGRDRRKWYSKRKKGTSHLVALPLFFLRFAIPWAIALMLSWTLPPSLLARCPPWLPTILAIAVQQENRSATVCRQRSPHPQNFSKHPARGLSSSSAGR